MKVNTKIVGICLISVVLALSTGAALAAPTVSLSWYKNNGYGWGNDIGGEWTITADVSSDVTCVEFYVDDTLVQNATDAPFKWAFNTEDYSNGEHAISAIAYDNAGEMATTQVDRNFVEYSASNILWLIVTIFVVSLVIVLAVAIYKVKKNK